ncbi:PrgI family protein [Patescibacteria group bacterium]|nr:PrgI family protein [Patescibacteria group bacterium]
MARYQVPQFIEVEDKIFGPLTFKQFIYLAGGGGLSLAFFTLLPLWLAVIFIIPVMVFAAALAFYEVNGRPFIVVLEHAFGYLLGNKLYLWKPHTAAPAREAAGATAKPPGPLLPVPKLSESRLKDLAWSLNIKDRTTMGVTENKVRTGFEI